MSRKMICFLTAAAMLTGGCNVSTPENYFDQAVLNCNMMTGFAGSGQQLELEQPSARLVPGTKDHKQPMKRKDLVAEKLDFLQKAFKNIKELKETDDSRDMLKAAVEIYRYILPVYKKEYAELANLYDNNAPATEIAAMNKAISDQYYAGFEQRLELLTKAGKPYAERHNIKVNWDVQTSPSP